MPFVIAGVTGNTGKVAAEALLAEGKSVRVLVRDAKKGELWKARGAEVAVADLGDEAALTRALEGADGAYLLVPPNMQVPDFRAYQDATVSSIVGAVRAARLPHLVLLSSIGAELPSGTGPIVALHHAERALRALPDTASTFVRAAYFMENLGGSLGMLESGLVPSFGPADHAVPMIATVDIGRLAAALLVEGRAAPPVVELGGAPLSVNDVARVLTEIVGRAIRVQEAPVEAMAGALQGFGIPAQIAGLYQEMTASMISGKIAWEGGHVRREGKTPLEAVLRQLLGRS